MNEAVELVKFIVTQITGDPDCFTVSTKIDEAGALLTISITKENGPRVIGKEGSTAQAIRTVLRALGQKNRAHYALKIEIQGEQ